MIWLLVVAVVLAVLCELITLVLSEHILIIFYQTQPHTMFLRKLSSNLRQSAMVVQLSRMSTKPNFPSSTYKTTTGLVGLAVDTNARNTLLQLTDTCLQSVKVLLIFFFLVS
jgi:hypothetical protein